MKKNNKGFTLAELLIVVAIIAVLVAIAIPVFTNQLERSREATDMANVRSAYGELISQYLMSDPATVTDIDADIPCKQTKDGWNFESGVIGTDITVTGASSATSIQISDDVGQGKTITLTIHPDGTIDSSVA
ncbi:MAG: prepilin-type N-terminal cleavage/methylation domain-containing protein [Oscillospiraceae bacterium]|nr:prepilin-type N-terminal cleavage/methylation domain-containing protein [Oscillospiraceae bacterium]